MGVRLKNVSWKMHAKKYFVTFLRLGGLRHCRMLRMSFACTLDAPLLREEFGNAIIVAIIQYAGHFFFYNV